MKGREELRRLKRELERERGGWVRDMVRERFEEIGKCN